MYFCTWVVGQVEDEMSTVLNLLCLANYYVLGVKGVKCEEKYYRYCNYNKIERKVEKAIAPKGLPVHLYFRCFIAHCEEETL